MSEINYFQNFLTPLLTAAVGTAGGAFIVNLINDSKINHSSKSNQINSTNALIAECNIQISAFFNYLEDISNQYKKHLEQKPIAIRFCENQSNPAPYPNMEKFYLDKISPSEIKFHAKESQASFLILNAASKLVVLTKQIQTYEKDLHQKYDEIASLIRDGKTEHGLKDLFGIDYQGMTQNVIEPCFINLINATSFSILLIEEIINRSISEKNKLIENYGTCGLKKLPDLISLDISPMKSSNLYPIKSEFNYFDSFKEKAKAN